MASAELKERAAKCWNELEQAYTAAKQLLIESEEKLTRMRLFPAPLLEHRDALDHLMRYSRIYNELGLCESAVNELNNAKQHEIRAFFDIADYICVIIRSEINDTLSVLNARQIKNIWADYETVKKRVVDISERIAAIRKDRTETVDRIETYQDAVSEMFDIYYYYQLNVLPKVGKRWLHLFKKYLNN